MKGLLLKKSEVRERKKRDAKKKEVKGEKEKHTSDEEELSDDEEYSEERDPETGMLLLIYQTSTLFQVAFVHPASIKVC